MRKFLILAAVLASAAPAHAQQQERTFTVTLPESQWNYIGKVVARQPYEESAPTIGSIITQIQQQSAREAAAAEQQLRDRIKSESKTEPAPTSPTPPMDKQEPNQ